MHKKSRPGRGSRSFISVRVAGRILNGVLLTAASFVFVTSAMGELSVEDLDKIGKIIQ